MDWLAQFYNDSCVLTNFSELVMLFDIANIKLFSFEFHINEFQRMLMKHPMISRKNNEKKNENNFEIV